MGAGGKTFYIHDGDLLLGEIQANGTVTAAYTWGANGLVSERLVSQNRSLWYAFGPQGETRQLVQAVVDVPEEVRVEEEPGVLSTLYKAHVAPSDLGKAIGADMYRNVEFEEGPPLQRVEDTDHS